MMRQRFVVCTAVILLTTSSGPLTAQDPCAQTGTSALWNQFVQATASGTEPALPDFSYAGYRRSEAPIPDVVGPIFDVTAHGAAPNDLIYDDAGIQAAIDAASAAGGGVVFLPAGRYLVSPSETEAMTIRIAASRIVLRGAGSEDGGTEILMVHKRQGKTMFNVAPTSFSAGTVAIVTENAVREGYWLTVDDVSKLFVGQWVILRHSSQSYSPHYWWPLSLGSNWTRVLNGTGVHEVHQIAEVRGGKVRFREPLHFNVVLGTSSWRLDAIKPLEEVGIEDIRFTGSWDQYPETFVHHKDWIHDSGWTMMSVRQCVNSWVRRCEFRHTNNAVASDTASFITFDGLRFTGKKGHTSISHRRGNGVLIKDSVDTAAFHHGPGTGYTSVNVVYLRHQMQSGQAVDNHGGVPHATLLDDVTGGSLSGNGGPYDNYPHHGKYYVLWNFVHRRGSSISYDFWDTVNRDSNTFALPMFSGFTANNAVTFQNEATEVGANESFGTPVTPKSLFEAQLQLRQCRALPPPEPPGPAPSPTATPYPTATATPTPTPTPAPLPGGPLGPNLARNKPSFASSNWSSSFNSPKAFDGTDSSRWSAAAAMATNQFLGVNFGASTSYNCVVMKEINFKRVVSHVLQMSDDGVTYTDIPGTSGGAIGALKTTCFETVTSRYFRLFLFEARQSGSLKEPTVNEVQVYFQDRPPVITVPETITLEATGPEGAVATFVATADDEKDGPVSVTLLPASGSMFPLGTTMVTATATDSAGNKATETFDVIVEDTTAPALSLRETLVVEATSAAGATVDIAASAQDVVSGNVPVTLSPPSGSTFPLGTTTVVATATDDAGNTATGEITVTVRDTTAPLIERLAASSTVLWPPNHAMHPIQLAVQVSEAVDAAPVTRVVSVASSEAEDGAAAPDWSVDGDLTLQLRAERAGSGPGRTYAITVESRDAAGNASRRVVEVFVPHDQRN